MHTAFLFLIDLVLACFALKPKHIVYSCLEEVLSEIGMNFQRIIFGLLDICALHTRTIYCRLSFCETFFYCRHNFKMSFIYYNSWRRRWRSRGDGIFRLDVWFWSWCMLLVILSRLQIGYYGGMWTSIIYLTFEFVYTRVENS